MGNRAGSSPVARTKYKKERLVPLLFIFSERKRQDLNPLNATVRWTVAADSWMSANLNFCRRQKCKRISSGSPHKNRLQYLHLPKAKMQTVNCCGARYLPCRDRKTENVINNCDRRGMQFRTLFLFVFFSFHPRIIPQYSEEADNRSCSIYNYGQ